MYQYPQRPVAFVLASSDHGSMIVNVNDNGGGFGVGYQIFNKSSCDRDEIVFECSLLDSRRQSHGHGVVALDCGANIGTRTVEWSRHMAGWGGVVSFEAQQRVYYALAGNVALNNCFNATPVWSAVGAKVGTIDVPVLDYCRPASFGSLEIRQRAGTENIGQPIDYGHTISTPMIAIDDMKLSRADLIKIDVEGMEMDVLEGARNTIASFKPMMWIETLKTDAGALHAFLSDNGYDMAQIGINLLAVHSDDPYKI